MDLLATKHWFWNFKHSQEAIWQVYGCQIHWGLLKMNMPPLVWELFVSQIEVDFCLLRNYVYLHAVFLHSSLGICCCIVSLSMAWARGTVWSCTVKLWLWCIPNILRKSGPYGFEWKLCKLRSRRELWSICWYSQALEAGKYIKYRQSTKWGRECRNWIWLLPPLIYSF